MKENNLDPMRHSAAHLLAAAVLRIWPDTKITIGPAIENGFYYDMDFSKPITDADLPKIEKMMAKTLTEWSEFTHREVDPQEAREIYKDNPYKLELIEEIVKKALPAGRQGEKITLYKAGYFEDLCRGGHSKNPSQEIGAFKLLSLAGAYWRGNEKNKMLTRIYGTVFPTQKELDDYLNLLEEAKKRDHRKLGETLDLFTFSELVGKGLPLFTPKGTILREELNNFSQNLRLAKGFQKVWVPHITKKELYETSGHFAKFGNELFLVTSQETTDEMVMKPMNCPHHQQIYASKPRSYKDLPIKYLETTTIYRDEKAGELLGLSRVRSVTQDDSHTFCTPEQIYDIYQDLIEITKEFYNTLGMKYTARLSFRSPQTPEKYLGEEKLWEKAQDILLKIAQENALDYYVVEGEAAFYGPKIDFMVTDALGRQWQLATPQLDFVQPKRFGLTYTDNEGKEQTPVMIHFALLGSIERFLSVYIEHTAGAFPVWLAPVQVAILPISDKTLEFAKVVEKEFKEAGIRVELDDSSSTLGAKIRTHTLQKVPFQCIIGDKEVESSKNGDQLFISIRERSGKDLGIVELSTFLSDLQKQIEKRI